MKQNPSFLRNPVDTESRLQLRLPCTIHCPNQAFEVFTFNISYSGIGVELPADASEEESYLPDTISIPDIGTFDVYVRWRRGLRIGCAFSAKRSARPVLDAYFKKTGTYPL